MPAPDKPVLPPGVVVGLGAGEVAGGVIGGVQGVGDAVTSVLYPAWLTKAGAYLTDRGTLIRIGTFAAGAVMCTAGVLWLLGKPAVSAGKAVVGVVK